MVAFFELLSLAAALQVTVRTTRHLATQVPYPLRHLAGDGNVLLDTQIRSYFASWGGLKNFRRHRWAEALLDGELGVS